MTYDFDTPVPRQGLHCVRDDGQAEYFGCQGNTPMWVADMDFAVCPDIMDALRGRLQSPVLSYPAIQDSYYQSIIDWLGHRHGLSVEREQLAYIGGVVKGVALAVNHFSRPGDKVVIQPPVYYPFARVIEGNDRRVVENPLVRTADGYRMDLGGLERVIAEERPAMMVLCNPHNPIGLQWDAETLRKVADICHRHGVVVVSDEIHGDLMPKGRHVPFLSVSPEAREVGIMLGAPSKTFNIPALQSSWYVVANEALREPFFRWLEVNELSTPTEAAALATEAAYTRGEEWLEQCLAYLRDNMLWVRDFCRREMPLVDAIVPQASFLMWMDMRRLGLDQSELMRRLLHVAHVAANDGSTFGTGGTGYVRLNVAVPRALLMDAMQRIAAALRRQ